ncbi:MAG TPA: M4 family metallopeptidase, partial [Myxococcota bacterium]|nr:M4 family metallopeptidase [Myxococcota bacterium]
RDELGRTNVRLARTYDGVPIFGSEVVTHLGSDGTVRDVTSGTLPNDLSLDTKPRMSEDSSMVTAVSAFAAIPERTHGPSLVVVKLDDGEFRLAHYIALSAFADGKPRRTHYFVDAHSGELLPLTFSDRTGARHEQATRQVSEARNQGIAATRTGRDVPAEGTGNSIFSGNVPLTTTRDGDGYVLRDPTHNDAETRDAHNGAGGSGSRNTVFTDNDNRWAGPGDDARVRDAVDAQYAAVQYLKYLREIFGRNSLDDRGKRLLSNVHVYNNYANAFWDGETMNYGDGDGCENLSQTDSDTGGHEATHGLTDATSRLIYRGESGALNEAGSDVIGAAGFNWFLRGARGAGVLRDYLLFEDSYTPNIPDDAIRYMNDPTKDKSSRDNYRTRYTGSADNGGVHWNSGIANNFFYLLAEGGVNRTSQARVVQGLGMEKALRIYYRAHNVYFTPDTTFQAARIGWLKAATDLFGVDSVEVRTVAEAADAVGIPGPARPPTDAPLFA